MLRATKKALCNFTYLTHSLCQVRVAPLLRGGDHPDRDRLPDDHGAGARPGLQIRQQRDTVLMTTALRYLSVSPTVARPSVSQLVSRIVENKGIIYICNRLFEL